MTRAGRGAVFPWGNGRLDSSTFFADLIAVCFDAGLTDHINTGADYGQG